MEGILSLQTSRETVPDLTTANIDFFNISNISKKSSGHTTGINAWVVKKVFIFCG